MSASTELGELAATPYRRHGPSRCSDSTLCRCAMRLRSRSIFARRRSLSAPTSVTCWRIVRCRSSRFWRHRRAALRFLDRLSTSSTGAAASDAGCGSWSTSTVEQPAAALADDRIRFNSPSAQVCQPLSHRSTVTVLYLAYTDHACVSV